MVTEIPPAEDDAPANNPSISWREYIQWFPEPASEPTSTLVLTSARRYFVDLRIYKPVSPNEPALPNEGGPLSRLEWGFAGTAASETVPPPKEIKFPNLPLTVTHSVWTHWLDSRASPDETVKDEGWMYPDEEGLVIERGAMVNPATGRVGEYEECWRDEDGEGRAVVLTLLDEGAKGMVIRVGGWCQGIVKVSSRREDGGWDSEITLERWQRVDGQWERVARIGRLFLPCAVAWSDDVKEGGQVSYQGWEWKVAEVTKPDMTEY